jgi:HEAT repeat protein
MEQTSSTPQLAALIGVLGARGAKAGVPELLGFAESTEPAIRKASLNALGVLAGEKEMPALVKILLASEKSSDRKAAEDAVVDAARGIVQEDARVSAVLSALPTVEDAKKKSSLLTVLGRIGGPKSLEAVHGACKDGNADVRDAAVRSLAYWNDASAMEHLLAIAKDDSNKTHQILALQNYIRLIGTLRGKDVQIRFSLYKDSMKMAERAEEKTLVLSGLSGVKTVEALAYVMPYLDDADLREEAAMTAMQIANSIDKRLPEVQEAAEKVVEVSTQPQVVKYAKGIINPAQAPTGARPPGRSATRSR